MKVISIFFRLLWSIVTMPIVIIAMRHSKKAKVSVRLRLRGFQNMYCKQKLEKKDTSKIFNAHTNE